MAGMKQDCSFTLLFSALRQAPRPYRMPPLPADADAARWAGVDATLAFALESARVAHEGGHAPPLDTRPLFLGALAAAIRAAMRTDGGDPTLQARVLRARDPDVEEHAALQARAGADARAVRAAVAALAHPAKLSRMAPSAARDALTPLHLLAEAGDWEALYRAAGSLPVQPPQGEPDLRNALGTLQGLEALQRLRRGAALQPRQSVQRYRALCGQGAPLAGSDAAVATGRAAARLGAEAEAATLHAFGEVAALLNQQPRAPGAWQALHGLRTPGGFPGAVHGSKDEWDVALVRAEPATDAVDIVLLAEVKASAAAATTDLPRLRRGLQRLAQAQAKGRYAFACAAGEVRISAASLRALQPPQQGLPPQAIYCCTAPADTAPKWLAVAAKAMLLAEPASLAFACALAHGKEPDTEVLAPVWASLTRAPQLRTALGQYALARSAREAMRRPQDLLSAVTALVRTRI
jgi:hypothetical protein